MPRPSGKSRTRCPLWPTASKMAPRQGRGGTGKRFRRQATPPQLKGMHEWRFRAPRIGQYALLQQCTRLIIRALIVGRVRRECLYRGLPLLVTFGDCRWPGLWPARSRWPRRGNQSVTAVRPVCGLLLPACTVRGRRRWRWLTRHGGVLVLARRGVRPVLRRGACGRSPVVAARLAAAGGAVWRAGCPAGSGEAGRPAGIGCGIGHGNGLPARTRAGVLSVHVPVSPAGRRCPSGSSGLAGATLRG